MPYPLLGGFNRQRYDPVQSDNLFGDFDIHKMKESENYYRIRTGQYRIGCKIPSDHTVIFYRVKSRGEI